MILGYLDADDRVYDLRFATLRLRIRVAREGPSGEAALVFTPSTEGQATEYRVLGEASVTAAVGMDHGGDTLPLLRPVEGRLMRHERGLLFLASPNKRDPEDPSFFLVKLQAMPSAVQFFFEDRGGFEIVSVPAEEIVGIERHRERLRVVVSAAALALPKESLSYAFDLSPPSTAERLLEGLVPSRVP